MGLVAISTDKEELRSVIGRVKKKRGGEGLEGIKGA